MVGVRSMMSMSGYAALFMTTGVQLPFLLLWLADWGPTPAEIGLYTALGMAVRVVAGLAIPASARDRLDQRRLTIVACAAAGIVLYLAHLGIHTRPLLLAATLAVGAVMAGIGPIAEALGRRGRPVLELPLNAQARGIGSLGFLVANLAAGAVIARTGAWDRALVARRHRPRRRPRPRAAPSRRAQGPGPDPARPRRDRSAGACIPTFALSSPSSPSSRRATRSCTRSARCTGARSAAARPRSARCGRPSSPSRSSFSYRRRPAVQWIGPVRGSAVGAGRHGPRWGAMMADPTGFWLWPIQGLHTPHPRDGAPRRDRLHRPRRARPLRRGGAGRRLGRWASAG